MLPAIIGPKRAAEVLLRNLTITAEQAVTWGIASRVVPPGLIRDEALRVARDITDNKPGSIGQTKRLLVAAYGDLGARLEAERLRFIEQIAGEEARLGILAFLGG